MHNNRYTFMFAIILSAITAVILVVTSQSLKPLQEENIALDKKKSILKSVWLNTDDKSKIESVYGESVTEYVVNSEGDVIEGLSTDDVRMKDQINIPVAERKMPLYVFNNDEGSYYIVPMRGVGLWGPIWGYVSIEDDGETIYGSFFDHKQETPGLGAEISEAFFQERFKGKKLLNDANEFVSVNVVKKTTKTAYGAEHRVDAISGGTITSDGVDEMLKNCVEPYLAYFEKN